MKILKKLSINPEKVINDDQLVKLKGGYGSDMACYFYSDYNYTLICCKLASSYSDCYDQPAGTVYTSYNTSAACDAGDYCN